MSSIVLKNPSVLDYPIECILNLWKGWVGSMVQYDFFVSHANEDAEYASGLVTALEARGVKCWIAPRNIPGGSDYGSEIVRAIQSSRAMLLIMSLKANDAAKERKHILRELEEASNFRKPIYPIRIEPVELHDSLRYRLSITQWIEHINDRDKLAEIIINLLNQQAVKMPGAIARARPKFLSMNISMIFGLLSIFVVGLLVNHALNFNLSSVDRQAAESQLVGRGYQLNNSGIEQAIRRNDMQSVVWFREIGVRLTTSQVHTLILDNIKKQAYSLTPIWEFLSQAGALDEVAKIRKELRTILERNSAFNHLYELSCKQNSNSDFWPKTFREIFGPRCQNEALWYSSIFPMINLLIEISNVENKSHIFSYKPTNISDVTSGYLRLSSERERQPEFLRIKTFFSISKNQLIMFTEDGINIAHDGNLARDINLENLTCRAENRSINKMCEATVLLFVPASPALRRSVTLPMHPIEVSNRILEILRGSRVLAFEKVSDSVVAATRSRDGFLVPCQSPPGAASRSDTSIATCSVARPPPDASMSLE